MGLGVTCHPFEELHKLRWLSISNNNLGTGHDGDLEFVNTLSNKTSLELISINANNFGGHLPISITNLTSLSILALDLNELYGDIPAGIGNLVNLESMNTERNKFTGNIPQEIGKLQQLKKLSFSGNKFTGNIPSSVGNLTQLTHLYMSLNYLSGGIPPTLGKYQNLLLLNLNHNNLSGPIPKEVMSIPSIAIYMGMSGNNLNGSLPIEVGTLKNLGVLDLSSNMLSGEIPATLGSCVSLERLRMQDNFFVGKIPPSLNSLRGMEVLDFSYNNLSAFSKPLTKLRVITLEYNNQTGGLPPYFGNFSDLEGISTTVNNLGDETMVGHVGDFGLTRFFKEGTQNYSAPQSSTIEVRGTIGYTAEGKRPTDEMFKVGMNLHTYTKAGLPMQIEKILDSILLQNLNNQRNSKKCLISIFEIGLACSNEMPNERMNMKDATAQLITVKEKLLRGLRCRPVARSAAIHISLFRHNDYTLH
ncbi:hypothetical protein L6164_020935 [Bauhinia variegata]|uniref:Uncharacterized protein n=1 Tax=Bauhinia variegata TaxID=167791 RepID=A0ACB9N1U5_BAUVA|nr:hypothetical protein L6164_020935 [Bauhinia variegata]